MFVKAKKLDDRAIAPVRSSKEAACYDLAALEDTYFKPGEIKLVRTGWSIQPPKGWRANIYVRSSTPIKHSFLLANSIGVIDNDYRGELYIQLMNVKKAPSTFCIGDSVDVPNFIKRGQRIAQLEFVPYTPFNIVEVDKLDDTERGEGGFGSTGN